MQLPVNSLPVKLAIGLLLSVLLLNFGDALVFDRIFLALLVVATFISFPINKDTFSILAIVCLFFALEELHWLIITEDLLFPVGTQSVWLKLYCYGLCLTACYLQRFEKISIAIAVVTFIGLGFEIYWLYFDLSAIEMYWFVLTSALALLARHALFYRPHILHSKFPDNPDWTFSQLDYDFDVFLKLLLILEAVMIIEYLVRYATDNSDITFVYNGYSYIAQGITLYLLLSTFFEIKRNHTNKNLSA